MTRRAESGMVLLLLLVLALLVLALLVLVLVLPMLVLPMLALLMLVLLMLALLVLAVAVCLNPVSAAGDDGSSGQEVELSCTTEFTCGTPMNREFSGAARPPDSSSSGWATRPRAPPLISAARP